MNRWAYIKPRAKSLQVSNVFKNSPVNLKTETLIMIYVDLLPTCINCVNHPQTFQQILVCLLMTLRYKSYQNVEVISQEASTYIAFVGASTTPSKVHRVDDNASCITNCSLCFFPSYRKKLMRSPKFTLAFCPLMSTAKMV